MDEPSNIPEKKDLIDEAMLEMADLLSQMNGSEEDLASGEYGFTLYPESIFLDMPLQLDIQKTEDGRMVIGGSPPLYYVETTIMPVFHQLRMKIEVTKNEIE